ncbi:carboxypeptidase D [Actinidia rufa]|uniref:Carboxypeptidase D n=1 Tax=Actinidia rufa TaxID=165716 RepID=A0A7J0EGY6_9ERIC|nr:carboxypeptidase D [Actinidia rufa]
MDGVPPVRPISSYGSISKAAGEEIRESKILAKPGRRSITGDQIREMAKSGTISGCQTGFMDHSFVNGRRHLFEEDHFRKLDNLAQGYMTNSDLEMAVKSFGQRCANISRIYSIGKSVWGVPLWVMEISDKPGEEEAEPAFKGASRPKRRRTGLPWGNPRGSRFSTPGVENSNECEPLETKIEQRERVLREMQSPITRMTHEEHKNRL